MTFFSFSVILFLFFPVQMYVDLELQTAIKV